ncbi:MAG: patatin-like phospholipase family protein [Hyphomicrobium sp.]
MASDFYAQESVVFSSGALRPAVAASMALPVIFQPMVIDGRVLIDGGLVNPLPFDIISDEADLTVASMRAAHPCGARGRRYRRHGRRCLRPTSSSSARSSARSCARASPTFTSTPGTSRFQILDFLKIDEILAAAEAGQGGASRHSSHASSKRRRCRPAEPVEALPPPSASRPRLRRPILKRRRPAKG